MVTGGHGFIGRHVVRRLGAVGATPISIAHPLGMVEDDLPGEVVRLDLEDYSVVARAMDGCDFAVHLAARAGGIQFQTEGGEDVFTNNRVVTDNVLRACVANGVRRLFLASSMVTYRSSEEPLTEDHPQLGTDDRPNPYAWSKITDEVVAHWYSDLEVVVGRFGNVYGPGASFDPDRSTVVHALIDRAARREDGDRLVVWGDGTAVRSFVFVEDAARAVSLILEKGAGGEAYNIDGISETTVSELAELVRDAVNPSLELEFDRSKPAGAPYRVGSIEKLLALGYEQQTDLAEGLGKTVRWYRSHVD